MAPQCQSEADHQKFDYDYIIIGAGPAGVQMAYFLERTERTYIVFEVAEKAASFFENLPRQQKLISINKKNNMFDEDKFNLRHDWNSLLSHDRTMRFTEYSDDLYPQASDLHKYINDFVAKFNLNIRYNTKVAQVGKHNETFTITTEDGVICTSRCVLMATGATEENLPESIGGIELTDTYATYELNKEKYKNKMVLIIGGGNSSFESANYVSDTAAIVHIAFNKRIQFAWDTHYVGDLRAVNNNIIDMYHLKSMHATIGSQVMGIRRTDEGKLRVQFRDLNTHWATPGWLHFEIEYDYVISCMGWKYVKPDLFDDSIHIGVCKNGRYPKLSSCWETDTRNLFYIGAAMGAIDRQSASGFIHGFRYNIRTLHNILENRFFSSPLPHIILKTKDLQAAAEKIIENASIGDSLHQMNGFLCDVMLCEPDGRITYYTDIPRQHIMERSEFISAEHLFVIYLDYSFERFGETAKPVDNVHAPDFSNNRCASFLHPFIEYYSQGTYIDQTELQESFIVRFDGWSCSNLPQWKQHTNENYIKYFINDKMKWTEETFDLQPLPPDEGRKIFVPLSEDEMTRLMPLWEKSECKPSQELFPKIPMKKRQRNLRPTQAELAIDDTNFQPHG